VTFDPKLFYWNSAVAAGSVPLISNGRNPAPVEEQPVSSTTATASITAGTAARLMWSQKAREQ
jgi:hypothetical protein